MEESSYKSRVLVTGATGFVGRALVKRLKDDGYYVISVIRGEGRPAAGHEHAFCDFGKEFDLTAYLKRVDAVIHLAARVHVMNETSREPLEEFRRVNVRGTQMLARQAAASGVGRFIFLSSVKVNGEATDNEPFSEEDSANPQDPYAISKMEAEQAILSICRETEMQFVIVRPPLVYGPGAGGNFHRLVRLVGSGIPLPLALVRNKRSMVALANLVDFLCLCVSSPAAGNGVFLVSDGCDVSTPGLIGMIAAASGKKARLFPVPVRILYMIGSLLGRRSVVDRLCGSLQVSPEKAIKELAWRPPLGVSKAIEIAARHEVPDKVERG